MLNNILILHTVTDMKKTMTLPTKIRHDDYIEAKRTVSSGNGKYAGCGALRDVVYRTKGANYISLPTLMLVYPEFALFKPRRNNPLNEVWWENNVEREIAFEFCIEMTK